MVSKLLSGSTFGIYTADTGTAALVVTAATGVIPTTGYVILGQGNYDDGITWDNMDERTDLDVSGLQGDTLGATAHRHRAYDRCHGL